MKQLIVVGGPTASGKTDIALQLAVKLNGEIINADSMQVYKRMDIGTNKGKLREINDLKYQIGSFTVRGYRIGDSKIIGWLFNLVNPDYNFTVSEYQRLAYKVIDLVFQRNKVPILVGGTGLYIDAVLKGYAIKNNKPTNLKKRSKLDKLTVQELQQKLSNLGFDLQNLNESDRKNPRRLIRAIEKNKEQKAVNQPPNFKVSFYYPEYSKKELFNAIEKRAYDMVENGFINEVKNLLEQGYSPELKSMQSTGYRQVIQFLQGKIKTKKDLILAIAQAHKKYAKKQITWFESGGRNYDLQKIDKNFIKNS